MTKPLRWLVYYGPTLTPHQLRGVQLAILEPDHMTPSQFKDSKTKFIAYVSVGEVGDYRSYWPEVKGSPILVEQNPVWKSYLVDIRSEKWQRLLLDKVCPEILAKGYHGFFLDTVDTPIYLEEKDPQKYAGSKKAMVAFVRALKKKFPQAEIYPNNAFELLMDYEDVIAGEVVEDLHTRYDFEKKISGQTPMEATLEKEKVLDLFLAATKKPVLNILYDTSIKTPLARYAIKRSQKKGYQWYLTTVDLQKIGTMAR